MTTCEHGNHPQPDTTLEFDQCCPMVTLLSKLVLALVLGLGWYVSNKKIGVLA